jgi:hypothetical protein
MVAFKQPNSLKNLLVRAEMSFPNTTIGKSHSFPILTLKITPQRVLFNDEDFHSVEILETVVRQSGVLAHRKKCLFCKVTPVSIQVFVEGLLRFANVLEATNRTLKNVNNICTLAINSAKYFVLFSVQTVQSLS